MALNEFREQSKAHVSAQEMPATLSHGGERSLYVITTKQKKTEKGRVPEALTF